MTILQLLCSFITQGRCVSFRASAGTNGPDSDTAASRGPQPAPLAAPLSSPTGGRRSACLPFKQLSRVTLDSCWQATVGRQPAFNIFLCLSLNISLSVVSRAQCPGRPSWPSRRLQQAHAGLLESRRLARCRRGYDISGYQRGWSPLSTGPYPEPARTLWRLWRGIMIMAG